MPDRDRFDGRSSPKHEQHNIVAISISQDSLWVFLIAFHGINQEHVREKRKVEVHGLVNAGTTNFINTTFAAVRSI